MSLIFPPTLTGDSGSGGSKGLAPAPASGDAAANKFLKADATWAVPSSGVTKTARVYNSATQSINDSTATALGFDTENYDTDAIHDTVTNNSRLTCKTAGKYIIQGQCTFASNVVGFRNIQIKLNNATVLAESDTLTIGTGTDAIDINTAYSLAVNDYVELIVTQTSGGALNANNGTGVSWFAMASLEAGGSGDMNKSTYDAANVGEQLLGKTAAQTVTNKRDQPRVYSAANNASLTPEIDTYDVFHLTAMSAATTINNHSTSTPVDGEKMEIRFLDNGTARALTWGNAYVAKNGVALPATTTMSKNMACLFEWNANLSKWNLMASGTEA